MIIFILNKPKINLLPYDKNKDQIIEDQKSHSHSFLPIIFIVMLSIWLLFLMMMVVMLLGFIMWVILECHIIHFWYGIAFHMMDFPGDGFEHITFFQEFCKLGDIACVGCVSCFLDKPE